VRNTGMDSSRAFTDFYESTKDACLRAVVASGANRATAEDAVAEAYARAWAAWPRVSRHPAPAAWVVRVALNHHVSRWRRRRREVELLETHKRTLHLDQAESGQYDDLMRAVAALPERQRQVVALRIFLDLDTAQTSNALGIAPGTVTAHLHRAMTTLRSVAPTVTETCS
jgi:RNA polymerase sigma factor (sigma-70 family)